MEPGDSVKAIHGKFTNDFMHDFCKERGLKMPAKKQNQADILILTKQGNIIACNIHRDYSMKHTMEGIVPGKNFFKCP